jgi:P-type Cu+ transporter
MVHCVVQARRKVRDLGGSPRKISLPVTGMSCAACGRSVEGVLSGTDGVLSANVNLATGKATVEYDPARAGTGAMIRAVEDAGYGVE